MSELNRAKARKYMKAKGIKDQTFESLMTGQRVTVEGMIARRFAAQQAARTRKANRHRLTIDMFDEGS